MNVQMNEFLIGLCACPVCLNLWPSFRVKLALNYFVQKQHAENDGLLHHKNKRVEKKCELV